jgi:RepB DNA-primase from phage plasmid
MLKHRGLGLSGMVLRRQITSLPCSRYEVRLIHADRRQAYPGVRRWTASQLCDPATVSFLRIRNREGYDVYFRPYAGDQNAGYILLDLDQPTAGILRSLQAQGHEPSVVVETSPGRWQAWIRVSRDPLPPPLATRISRRLAQIYAADPASADWRHVGRLAGFTNRKPQRLRSDGLAPWVKLIYARACLARDGAALMERAAAQLPADGGPRAIARERRPHHLVLDTALDSNAQQKLYQACLQRLRILERYPSPDWSIADKWVARELLQTGMLPATVAAVLRHGSPGSPAAMAIPKITSVGPFAVPCDRSTPLFSPRVFPAHSIDPPPARACVCICAFRLWDTSSCLHKRVSYPSKLKSVRSDEHLKRTRI